MPEEYGESIIGKRVGNYVVERPLAQGGMGSVFVARHPALGREAAVKFLGQDLETPPEFTKRFLDEARITANLRHPNIVDIFDFGELNGRLYYVMELLEGQDLAAVMRQRKRLTCEEVIDFLEQTCAGLAAAHAVGVVHRDLKPGNIFLMRGDPPRLKLMDFGVAKIMSPQGEKTRYGQIIGTPRYMSPEQALGQNDRITPQSDIYSLGTIAYEMLAGVAPFEHDSPVMLLVMHVRDVVRPIREHVPETPAQLAELIEGCLAKDPKDRPASAQIVLERLSALRRWSSQRKIEIPPTGQALKTLTSKLDRAPDSSVPGTPSSPVRFANADTIPGQQTNPLPIGVALVPVQQREEPAELAGLASPAPLVLQPAPADEPVAPSPAVPAEVTLRAEVGGATADGDGRVPIRIFDSTKDIAARESRAEPAAGGAASEWDAFDQTLRPPGASEPAVTHQPSLIRQDAPAAVAAQRVATIERPKERGPSVGIDRVATVERPKVRETPAAVERVATVERRKERVATVERPKEREAPAAERVATVERPKEREAPAAERVATVERPKEREAPAAAERMATVESPKALVEPRGMGSGAARLQQVPTSDDGSARQAKRSAPQDSNSKVAAAPLRIIPTSAVDGDLDGPAESIQLTDSDRTTLSRLLARMQRRGDFPAFVQNISEVSKRADFESRFSAQQLGTSILKDYALTAKLLRIVNSSYAARFGGKIYSIQHAIVILGFDRVRSLAISTSLFKTQGNKDHSERISESAINSLVSGEIARQLHTNADLDDAEQATVCSMFRNLGRHLVLVYLPESYDQIVELMRKEGIGLNQASERVLGISMHKLGVGIAERWRFPEKIINAMCVVPERNGQLKREEDRLAALADFSNQLCEIVISDSTQDRAVAMRSLLTRHKNLVELEPNELTELIETAQRSFEKRYTSLLGVATRSSRFARSVASMAGAKRGERVVNGAEAVASRAASPLHPQPRIQAPAIALATPDPLAATPGKRSDQAQQKERPKRQVARIQLAKAIVPADMASEPTDDRGSESASVEHGTQEPETIQRERFDVAVEQALVEFGRSGASEQLLTTLLTAMAHDLNLPRILALRATANRQELIIVGGVGEDVDGLMREFRLPLAAARIAKDPFSLCFHLGRDFFLEDTFAPKATAMLPQRYYEAIGSTSVMLLSCSFKGAPTLVLMADLDPPAHLPSSEHMAQLTGARQAIARIAPNAAFRPPLQ